ncbi:sodium:solute symporter family protein [Rubellicoccus peritrichatus]|uniref:Sodium:solute symporter family protein n=1 Tax=Rubellicoccus peritrichatus TaxID=3080537 RepID=A0AAQ3LAN2_9BACT|nr:sodium:solute symporter family protein [Puniceicoccus sp. CR14]WOO42186.1 sodium:solute symporter family protein [Puniceicoccus sp. CR14]
MGEVTSTEPLIGPGGLLLLGLYLASLIVIGVFGRMARKSNTLGDFFLGGRSFGFFVLLLTLYATQYSGNTLIGFAGKSYRTGFSFLISIAFMMGVIGVYLVFAPKLYRLSREEGFVTLGDYIQHRFKNRTLTVLISISGIVALCNFLITNLKAIGEITGEVTGGVVSPAMGIAVLAVIIIIYETLGGLRSVAWTDVIQGLMLFFGVTIIFSAVIASLGGLENVTARLHEVRPDFWEAPGPSQIVTWISTLIVISVGIALYPQAIQRIYAAKDSQTLRRALTVMVFMPLLTTILMVSIGVLANIPFPGLSKAESEGATVIMLQNVADVFPSLTWIIILFVGAVLAAIMSTADSAMLSIASSVTRDLIQPFKEQITEASLTLFGKGFSWIVMTVATILAIILPQSIWALAEIKLELLVQCAPALLLGINSDRLEAKSVLAGFIAGMTVTLFFLLGAFFHEVIPKRPYGVHAGIWGLILNLIVITFAHHFSKRQAAQA